MFLPIEKNVKACCFDVVHFEFERKLTVHGDHLQVKGMAAKNLDIKSIVLQGWIILQDNGELFFLQWGQHILVDL